MNKKIFFIGVFLLSMTSFILAEVSYPISELGNCASQDECKTYCNIAGNMQKCISYAEENKLFSDEESQKAKKILPYLLSGETPGACKSREECDAYCREEEHLEECINFALKIGDITEKEAEMARKTKGKGPGGCRGIECKEFCEKDENIMTCVEFAYQNGMIEKEEYEMVKKTGGKGPGGCRGEKECEEYCKKNEKECMQWASEHGLMDEKGMQGREGIGKEESCILECLKNLGADPRSCGPSSGGEKGGDACRKCAEECVKYYEGPCLTDEQWRQKEEECMAKGEHMEAMPVEGTDPSQNRKCVVDIECIDRSSEWGDMPGEGPGIGEEGWVPPPEWSEEAGGPGTEEEQTQPEVNTETTITPETNTETPSSTSKTNQGSEETSEPSINSITAEVILTDKISQKYNKNFKLVFA